MQGRAAGYMLLMQRIMPERLVLRARGARVAPLTPDQKVMGFESGQGQSHGQLAVPRGEELDVVPTLSTSWTVCAQGVHFDSFLLSHSYPSP